MPNEPIQNNQDQIIIDKVQVESLTKRFLDATKNFFTTTIGQATWDRLGLETTWRYFLPLVIVLFLFAVTVGAKILAFLTLALTAIWLLKQAFGKK